MSDPNALPTFENVATEAAPRIEAETDAHLLIDGQLTFIDEKENGGVHPAELPVPGSKDRVPGVQTATALFNVQNCLTLATKDTHLDGNPTLSSSFEGIAPNTWITLAEAQSWLGRGNSPIRPDAGFTAEQYVKWLSMLDAGGAMAWNPHGNPKSPLYTIHPAILRTLTKNPNLQLMNKGSQVSRLVPGFYPESYSAVKMSTGESLGLAEIMRARGIKRVTITGFCGDFCAGESAIDLAGEGFEVWMVVDAQASVKVPGYAGTDLTSEQHMIQRLTAAGVRFTTLAGLLAANGYAVQS